MNKIANNFRILCLVAAIAATAACSDEDTPDFGSVTVSDQAADPANQVTIGSVVSVGSGFIVIHENGGGSPGPVIGHVAVADGANSDVVVTLDRDATNGETLFAMLHIDEGTSGTYEFPGSDGPATDSEGAVIVVPFEVTVP